MRDTYNGTFRRPRCLPRLRSEIHLPLKNTKRLQACMLDVCKKSFPVMVIEPVAGNLNSGSTIEVMSSETSAEAVR